MNKNWDRYIKGLKKNSDESGYVLLSTLFLVLVAITIGISIYMDSLSELGLTNSEESYSEAFNLAEAAIETVLIEDFNDISDRTITFATATGNVDVEVVAADGERFFEAEEVPQNSVVQVQLAGMGGSSAKIYWSGSGGCSDGNSDGKPSLIVEIWSDTGTINVDRYLFDASGCAGLSEGADDTAGAESLNRDGVIYTSSMTVNSLVGSTAKFMRIRPIYNSASIYVVPIDSPDTFPYQMKTVTATAKSVMADGVDNGEVEMSAIQVERYAGSMPDIFDYVLFTGGTLIK